VRDGDGNGIIDTNTKQWQHQVTVAMETTTTGISTSYNNGKCARINLQ